MKAFVLTLFALLPQARGLDELRTAVELERGFELLPRALEWIAPDGPLATNGEATALVARTLIESGDEGRAERLLDGAHPTDATRVFVQLERARLALLRDELERVIALAQPYREHPEALLLLARAWSRSGSLEKAEPLARELLDRAPLHPEASVAMHLLERAALVRRDVASAEQWAKRKERMQHWHGLFRARRLQRLRNPEAPEPQIGLALLWLEVEQYARAEAELAEVAARAPKFCRTWFLLGEARRLQGQLGEARAAYESGLACDPEDAKCRFNRGLLALQAGEVELARADFERLIAGEAGLDPTFAAAYLHLARLARDRGEDEAAYLERYRELGGREEL